MSTLEPPAYTKFPLIAWQATKGYETEYARANEAFDEIRGRLRSRGFEGYVGGLRMDENGYPEILLNNNKPYQDVKKLRPEQLMQIALRHGAGGWWDLDELHLFSRGGGTIVNRAMWEMGYKLGTNGKWKKKTKNDKEVPRSYIPRTSFTLDIVGWEAEKLFRDSGDFPSDQRVEGETYDIRVGANGLIYVALQVNPFAGRTAETIGDLAAQIRERGHIAREQGPFTIDARNVRFEKKRGVNIKAIRTDDHHKQFETLWPTQMSKIRLHSLATDLVSRVNVLLD